MTHGKTRIDAVRAYLRRIAARRLCLDPDTPPGSPLAGTPIASAIFGPRQAPSAPPGFAAGNKGYSPSPSMASLIRESMWEFRPGTVPTPITELYRLLADKDVKLVPSDDPRLDDWALPMSVYHRLSDLPPGRFQHTWLENIGSSWTTDMTVEERATAALRAASFVIDMSTTPPTFMTADEFTATTGAAKDAGQSANRARDWQLAGELGTLEATIEPD